VVVEVDNLKRTFLSYTRNARGGTIRGSNCALRNARAFPGSGLKDITTHPSPCNCPRQAMPGHMLLSYWPGAQSAPSDRRRGPNSYTHDGRSFHRCPPVAGATAKAATTAASADCFVVRPLILSGEQQAAERGEPYKAAESVRPAPTRIQWPRGRGFAMAVLGSQALLRMAARLVTMYRHFALLLLLLVLLMLRSTPVGAAVDLTIYGGAFDSTSTIAYSEVGA